MRRLVPSAAFILALLAACGPASEPDTRSSPQEAARRGIHGEPIKALDAAKALKGQADADRKRLQEAVDDAGG